MFGAGTQSEKNALASRGSIIDEVLSEARDLNRRLGAKDKKKMDEYLSSVREVERRVRLMVRGQVATVLETVAPETEVAANEEAKPPWCQDLETRLRASLGTKVQVLNGPEYHGKIVVEYFDRDQLERLMEQLAPAAKV